MKMFKIRTLVGLLGYFIFVISVCGGTIIITRDIPYTRYKYEITYDKTDFFKVIPWVDINGLIYFEGKDNKNRNITNDISVIYWDQASSRFEKEQLDKFLIVINDMNKWDQYNLKTVYQGKEKRWFVEIEDVSKWWQLLTFEYKIIIEPDDGKQANFRFCAATSVDKEVCNKEGGNDLIGNNKFTLTSKAVGGMIKLPKGGYKKYRFIIPSLNTKGTIDFRYSSSYDENISLEDAFQQSILLDSRVGYNGHKLPDEVGIPKEVKIKYKHRRSSSYRPTITIEIEKIDDDQYQIRYTNPI